MTSMGCNIGDMTNNNTFSTGYHIVPRGAKYFHEGKVLRVVLVSGEEYNFLEGAIVNSEEGLDSLDKW